jgi:hypothetical protein
MCQYWNQYGLYLSMTYHPKLEAEGYVGRAAWDGGIVSFGKPALIGGLPAVSAVIAPHGGRIYGVFATSDGNLNDGWNENVNQLAPGIQPTCVVGQPSVWTSGAQLHFTYRTCDGLLFDSYQDPTTGWNIQQLNMSAGRCSDALPAASDPAAAMLGGQQHFAYVDTQHHVIDIWFDGAWHAQQVN